MIERHREGRAPDFLCIGVQKAGTTWFSQMIRQHPNIWMPPVKEIQYFNGIHIPEHKDWVGTHRLAHAEEILREKLKKEKLSLQDWKSIKILSDLTQTHVNDEWYLGLFRMVAPSQICGEVTPEYSLLNDDGVAHIKKLNPDVKIILILRDPIERCWSHLKMLKSTKGHEFTIEDGLKYTEIYERVQYYQIIKRWNKFFDKGKITVQFYDGIGPDPKSLMMKVCKFLNIDFDVKYFKGLDRVVFKGSTEPIPASIYSHLKERLDNTYIENEKIFPIMGGEWRERHYR